MSWPLSLKFLVWLIIDEIWFRMYGAQLR